MIMAYPGGIAGAAFLLMRMHAALIVGRLAFEVHGLDLLVRVLLALAGAALLLGFLTRVAVAIAAVVLVTTISNDAVVLSRLGQVLALLALGMVGPGAYSVDARLFGRRVVYSNGPPAARKRGP
jgi:uncharacterized membrane protein YphA (DoxX/SURF4 family)